MKNLKLSILLALGIILFASCQKEYRCVCDDPNYEFVTVEAKNEARADKKCKAKSHDSVHCDFIADNED